MSERKLEPTPGWCERAAKCLVDCAHSADSPSVRAEASRLVSESGYLAHVRAVDNHAPLGHEGHNDWAERQTAFYCIHCRGVITADRKCDDCPARNSEPGRSGVVFGWDVPPNESTEVDPRLQGIPKPAPLPHEVDSVGKPICKHCGKYQYVSIFDGDTIGRLCPARNEPLPLEPSHVAVTTEDGKYICPARNIQPPAEKAEALPINIAAVYWLSDAICRSAAYTPAIVQKAIYNLIEYILAEVDKRIDRRGDAIGDRVAGLLLSNADAIGLIARDEISKAVVHAFNANVDEFVPRPDLYRIVPGKEGE